MLWILIGVGVIVVLGAVFLVLRRRRGKPLVSIVTLRTTTRNLTEADVRHAARRAIRDDVTVVAGPSPDGGLTRVFMVMLGEIPGFYVIDCGRTYVDDPGAESQQFEDLRARTAFAEHKAWVAVDLATDPGDKLRPQVLTLMAKLAAEFYDDNCTLLYSPALNRFAVPGPEVEAKLQAGDLDGLFGDYQVNLPIIDTGDDKRVEAANAKAKEEWPKLVEVWTRLGPASKAFVKGCFPYADGQEYMWVQVEDLKPGQVTGILMNEPVHVALTKGQTVQVSARATSRTGRTSTARRRTACSWRMSFARSRSVDCESLYDAHRPVHCSRGFRRLSACSRSKAGLPLARAFPRTTGKARSRSSASECPSRDRASSGRA
jgi:hypothetical protein